MRVIDAAAARNESLILLLGRVLLGGLYLVPGLNHLTELPRLERFMGHLPGPAIAWAVLAGLIEVAGAIALILGFRTRAFALLLAVFNLCAAVIGHPFWSIPHDPERWAQYIHFWKDIGLAGGCLFVLARGAGPISLDRR